MTMRSSGRINRFHVIAVILLVCGVLSLGYSVASGESSAGLVVIIPVIYGSGLFAFLGIMFIMGAIMTAFMGFAQGAMDQDEGGEPSKTHDHHPGEHGPHTSVKGGGVVMLGPIPIIFGSDKKTAKVMAVLAIILMVLMIVFMVFFLWR